MQSNPSLTGSNSLKDEMEVPPDDTLTHESTSALIQRHESREARLKRLKELKAPPEFITREEAMVAQTKRILQARGAW